MKYLFIILFVILNKSCLVYSYAVAKCYKFENLQQDEENFCWTHSYSWIEEQKHNGTCLRCTISNIHAELKSICGRIFYCMTFIFHNKSLFEDYFRNYPIVDKLFLKPPDEDAWTRLVIILENYDLRDITFQYLNSILNISSRSYQILNVIFIKPLLNHTLSPVKNDFYSIPTMIISLLFSCNYYMNDKKWIEYKILPNGSNFNRSKYCSSIRVTQSSTKNMYVIHNRIFYI